MATHSTLNELFTDIADAIRSKTGSSAKISADNFPSNIRAITTGSGGVEGGIIPTGTIHITANGTHDVTEYEFADVMVSAGGEGIEVGSLSELHYWSKYTVGGTVTETKCEDILVDMATSTTYLNANVAYASAYEIVDDKLSLKNPTTINLYGTTTSERNVILGKYIHLEKKGGYYRVPNDAVVTVNKPTTGYITVYIDPAYRLTYTGADGEFVSIVVSNDSTAYPHDGVQDGYKYVYNGTLDNYEGE